MPKPKKGVAGSGMHLNISLYQEGKNLFQPEADGSVSDTAAWFMGGIMAHAKAMCAISNPLVNSYKRLSTGFDAPSQLTWTRNNDNTLLRVRNRIGENCKVELRFPDPSANPYLVIALAVAAGMDGIEHKLSPGKELSSLNDPTQESEYLPMTLREAIIELQKDDFVQQVLGEEFTGIYCEAKNREWTEYMNQVSDWEVETYLNQV
jgi:glutamine synthetase